jgi:adenylate cyclase
MNEVLSHFRTGLDQYRKGHWDRAIAAFEEALSLHPGDKPSRLYAKRCEYLKENPPEGEWKGVWVMESK